MTTSAPRPRVRSRTHATRSASAGTRVMSSVSSAPRRRAAVEPRLRRADDVDRERSRELREDRGVQAHGPRALDDDGVAHRDAGALDRVETGRQAASAAQEILGADPLGQRHQPDSRENLDPLRPASEQPVRGGGRDAVDPAMRAARRRAGDEAVPAGAARSVDVVERDERPRRDRAPLDVGERSVRLEDPADTHVARDDRVGNAREPAVVEVDVGAADLARDGLEHRAAGAGAGRGQAPRLERTAGRRHEHGLDGVRQVRHARGS